MKRAAFVVKSTSMKHLICALALLATLTPALAQQDKSPFDKIPPAKPVAVTMKSGFVVTPIVVPDDDLRSMLDVQMWHFLVKAPKGGATPTAHLELRVPGKPPQILTTNDGGILDSESSDFVVGLAPANGTSLSKADKWKVYLRTRSNAADIFSASASNEEENPIKDLKFELSRYNAGTGYALPNPNGDIPLISLYKINFNPPGKPTPVAELVLVLSAKSSAQ